MEYESREIPKKTQIGQLIEAHSLTIAPMKPMPRQEGSNTELYRVSGGAWLTENCSGLMNPGTDLGENARHEEVSDDQATTCVFP